MQKGLHGKLVKENEDLKQSVKDLRKKAQTQDEEIAALKIDLENARAVVEMEEKSTSGTDEDDADANSQNGDLKDEGVNKSGIRYHNSTPEAYFRRCSSDVLTVLQ